MDDESTLMKVKEDMLKEAGFEESPNFWSNATGHEIRKPELEKLSLIQLRRFLDGIS